MLYEGGGGGDATKFLTHVCSSSMYRGWQTCSTCIVFISLLLCVGVFSVMAIVDSQSNIIKQIFITLTRLTCLILPVLASMLTKPFSLRRCEGDENLAWLSARRLHVIEQSEWQGAQSAPGYSRGSWLTGIVVCPHICPQSFRVRQFCE